MEKQILDMGLLGKFTETKSPEFVENLKKASVNLLEFLFTGFSEINDEENDPNLDLMMSTNASMILHERVYPEKFQWFYKSMPLENKELFKVAKEAWDGNPEFEVLINATIVLYNLSE